MNKIHKELFLNTSNEVIWPKKILNSMHRLKSAILAILPEMGRLAGLAYYNYDRGTKLRIFDINIVRIFSLVSVRKLMCPSSAWFTSESS